MSLTDKVIKNTFYYFAAQIFGFIFPLFLTPFIIGKIGTEAFGIYALVLGFTGTLGLFDLSISSSFIKFISEYYNKHSKEELNKIINSGMFFYVIFSLIFCIIGFGFTDALLSLINIPAALYDISVFAFRISLIIFFIVNSFGIFNSVLVSLQKMYMTSILATLISILNFVAAIILLSLGYGLYGLILSQLIAVTLNLLVSYYVARKQLPEMKIRPRYFSMSALKKMLKFGIQMQVSRLSLFASDKYDEFLLAYFSVLSSVTYFNIGAKVARTGRFLPFQLVPQVAPVAAELNAKDDKINLNRLFHDTTKYLTMVSVPVFIYIIFFADTLILTWMGPGFEMSIYLLRILAIGQLVNMIFSAPGNSITPNIGHPKYQMYEGLINLCINLVLSFIFIKYYGIIGAAIGNSIAIVISSLYVFYVSSRFFNEKISYFLKEYYKRPLINSIVISLVLYLISLYFQNYISKPIDRISGAVYLALSLSIFSFIYLSWLFTGNYLNTRDKHIAIKILLKMIPLKYIVKRRRKKYFGKIKKDYYDGELISIFIITYNRLYFLKKCINSLLPTLEKINYEIIIWDNNSSDGTKEYLKSIEDERIHIVLNEENIGTNAKSEAAEMCKGEFIIGLDDDVINFPSNWIENMVRAYKVIPFAGYLSTNVIQDEFTNGAKPPDELYIKQTYNDGNIEFQNGPAGGWCFMISRDVYNKVGKLKTVNKRIFFGEDADYVLRVLLKGFKMGIVGNVKVYHATGEKLNRDYGEIYYKKMEDFNKGYLPRLYKYKLIFNSRFNLKLLYYKLLQFAETELDNEK